jgi:ribosomal protein L7/L12
MILLIRELRDLTGKNIREVSDIVNASPSAIGQAMMLTDATALKKRIERTGARLEVRPR